MASAEELQKLLLIAEGKFGDLTAEIETLKLENQNLSQSFFELMEAQQHETEQMVQLTEQIWALEEALALSREKAMEQMQVMKGKFNSMNEYMQDTLEAASKNASSMELAARVYELSKVTEIKDIDEQLIEFNEQLKPGKL